MNIEYSGWHEDRGPFRFLIPVDEKKEDYEIHLKNGDVFVQDGPFHERTTDWNHDGDVYPQFGAFFQHDGRGEFLTPTDMVWMMVEEGARIPGIETPLISPSLDDKIQHAEDRKTNPSRTSETRGQTR